MTQHLVDCLTAQHNDGLLEWRSTCSEHYNKVNSATLYTTPKCNGMLHKIQDNLSVYCGNDVAVQKTNKQTNNPPPKKYFIVRHCTMFSLFQITIHSQSTFALYTTLHERLHPTKKFSKAGLHEWVPFVIFRARNRERSLLPLSGPFLSRRCFTLCISVNVANLLSPPPIVKKVRTGSKNSQRT